LSLTPSYVWRNLRAYRRELLEQRHEVAAEQAAADVPGSAPAAPDEQLMRWQVEQLLVDRAIREGAVAEPRCSVVIPVYGQDALTLGCLRSLMLAPAGVPFEIIVVDNGSTDRTAEVLAYFGERVRVLRNAHNAGFVEACNQGAAAARGE